MRPYLRLPIDALRQCRSTLDRLAVLLLYETGDAHRWEPFQVPTSWLERETGISHRGALALLSRLQSVGLVREETPGSRASARVLRVLTPGLDAADHRADHRADHEEQPGNSPFDECGPQGGPQGGPRNRARAADSDPDPGSEDPSLSGEAIIAQQGQALSGQENPKPKKPADPMNAAQRAWVAETWQALQAIRGELQPGTRGQALTPPREAALRGAAKLLKAGGLTREDLYRAARWVYESPNPRAEGARATGDPVETLLRPSKLVTYCEVARDEEAGAVPVVEVAQAAPRQMTAEEREDMEMAAQYAKMDREAKAKLMDEWGDMPTGEDFEAAFREASTAQVDSRRSESDRVRDMVRRMRQWRDGTIGAQVLAFPAGGGR